MKLIRLILLVINAVFASGQINVPNCGQPKKSTWLVMGGETSEPGDWPWHAVVKYQNAYRCGGTLINEKFIITVAHCVHQLARRSFLIQLGVHRLNFDRESSVQNHTLKQTHVHPSFNQEIFRNDIALLETERKVIFSKFVQPACIQTTDPVAGVYGTAVGFGVTEHRSVSQVLRKVRMPVIRDIVCLDSNRDNFGETLHMSLFCAGYRNGTGVCNGDSGGGLFFLQGKAWFLGGMVSFSPSPVPYNGMCSTTDYAAFTKLSYFIRWINETAKVTRAHATLPQNCGIYNVNRIVRGERAKVFEFPWMALVGSRVGSTFKFNCAGSIISERYVLTAARCSSLRPKGYRIAPTHVRLGEHTLDQNPDCNEYEGTYECADSALDYYIQHFLSYPGYVTDRPQHDVALIRVSGTIQWKDHIQPICLPVTPDLQRYAPYQYIVTGWGATKNMEDVSKTLHKATLEETNLSQCQKWYDEQRGGGQRFLLDSGNLCVGGKGQADICTGDVGAPLGSSAWYHKTVRFVQFGIASLGKQLFGMPHCGFEPAIYTNVASYVDWIIENLEP